VSETFYPIRAVAKLTGVPLDTIRAWERRYRAVTPQRSARGRMYSEKEVQRLLLLRDAVARGHAIGQVADVRDDDLKALLRRTDNLVDSGVSGRRKVRAGDSNLGPLLKTIEAFDCAGADRELNRLSTAMASPRDVVHEVALPLMRITGERWHEGRFTIAQEHMVTELLSGLLVSLLRIYGTPNPPAKVLLATPENEHHGFGVLAAAMLTAVYGLGAIHLGTNLPAREIVQATRRTEANAVLLGVCGAKADSVIPAFQEIHKGVGERTHLWVGGVGDQRLAKAAVDCGWLVLENFHALEHRLELLRAGN
jgi:DNA-binding transcriptional MerR regulator/methylmalonyl-CoA mutase cobalamin-binding subunit